MKIRAPKTKYLTWSLICFLPILLGLVLTPKTPKEIVEEYCRLDAKGYRLSSKDYHEIQELMVQNEEFAEPGWDCFKILSRFKLEDTKIVGGEATVKVNYSICAEYCVGDQLNLGNKLESFVFQLSKTKSGWRIKNYVPFPRLNKSAAMKFFENEFGTDKEKIEKFRGELNWEERGHPLKGQSREKTPHH